MNMISTSALPSDPIDALRELARGEAELDRLRHDLVRTARHDGATWEQIGQALGVTRQSAWELFSRSTREAIERTATANVGLTEDEALDLATSEVRAVRRARRT